MHFSDSLSNYHTHCNYCDGKGTPEEIALAAIEKGFKYLGFSSHAPVHMHSEWNMPANQLSSYLAKIEEVRQMYCGQLTIFTGLEYDFFPGCEGYSANFFRENGVDYLIGSVHYLGKFSNGDWWTVDGSTGEFEAGLNNSFNGSIVNLITEYYNRLINLIDDAKPDILGHLDLPKKQNRHKVWFNENEKWYKELIYNVINRIKSSNTIIEVNTGGLARNRTTDLYPSAWIIKACAEIGVPLTLSSDAHHPGQLDAYFDHALNIIRDSGYRTLRQFDGKDWVEVRI